MNSKQILKQFKEEAPDSPYITKEYLKHFCKNHRKYILISPIHMGKIEEKIFKGKTMLEWVADTAFEKKIGRASCRERV